MAGRARDVHCRPVRRYGPPTACREANRFLKLSLSRSVPCASWVIAPLFGIRETGDSRMVTSWVDAGRKWLGKVYDKRCRKCGLYRNVGRGDSRHGADYNGRSIRSLSGVAMGTAWGSSGNSRSPDCCSRSTRSASRVSSARRIAPINTRGTGSV